MTNAVPEERPARSNLRKREVTGAIRVKRSCYSEWSVGSIQVLQENAVPQDRLLRDHSGDYRRGVWRLKMLCRAKISLRREVRRYACLTSRALVNIGQNERGDAGGDFVELEGHQWVGV